MIKHFCDLCGSEVNVLIKDKHRVNTIGDGCWDVEFPISENLNESGVFDMATIVISIGGADVCKKCVARIIAQQKEAKP